MQTAAAISGSLSPTFYICTDTSSIPCCSDAECNSVHAMHRSGLQAGQSRILFFLSHAFGMCAECGFTSSAWKMHGSPWKRCGLEGSICCCKISLNFSALMRCDEITGVQLRLAPLSFTHWNSSRFFECFYDILRINWRSSEHLWPSKTQPVMEAAFGPNHDNNQLFDITSLSSVLLSLFLHHYKP